MATLLTIKHLVSPMIVVIDALVECEYKDGVMKLVEIIAGMFQQGCCGSAAPGSDLLASSLDRRGFPMHVLHLKPHIHTCFPCI